MKQNILYFPSKALNCTQKAFCHFPVHSGRRTPETPQMASEMLWTWTLEAVSCGLDETAWHILLSCGLHQLIVSIVL